MLTYLMMLTNLNLSLLIPYSCHIHESGQTKSHAYILFFTSKISQTRHSKLHSHTLACNSLFLHLPHKSAVDRAAVVVHDVLVGGIVSPHVGGSGGGVGAKIVLDFSHAVLRVAQVRDQQSQRGVHVGLGSGDIRGLGEPTSFDDGVKQRTGNVGVGARCVMRIALHHPLSPQLSSHGETEFHTVDPLGLSLLITTRHVLFAVLISATGLDFLPARRSGALAEHLQNNLLALEDIRATAEVSVCDDRTSMQTPLGDDIVVRLAEVASATSELGLVSLVSDVVIIVVRVITRLLAFVVESLLSGSSKEPEKAVANIAAGDTLELLKHRTLGDFGGPQNFAFLWELFAPTADKIFEVDDTPIGLVKPEPHLLSNLGTVGRILVFVDGKIAPSTKSLHDSLDGGVHIRIVNNDVGNIR